MLRVVPPPSSVDAAGSASAAATPIWHVATGSAGAVPEVRLSPASLLVPVVALGRRRRQRRVARVTMAFFFGPGEAKEDKAPLDPRSVRLLNHTETPLEVLTFPKETMPYILGGDRVHLPGRSHVDVQVAKRSTFCRLALRRRDMAAMVNVPKGSRVRIDVLNDKSDIEAGPLEVRIADLQVTFDDGSSFDIFPGPLFWRLSRNVEDVEFQVAGLLRSQDQRVCFKVVREMGCDWRGAPMSRIRVISAGFLGTKFLHKGTMYLAKIVPGQAVEETINAFRKITGTFGQPENILHFEGYVKTDTGAHMLIFEDFGESLSKIMSSNSEILSVEDKDQCAEDLLKAVTSLHSSNIFHLALSPESVRLRRDGTGRMRLKLADLGTFERPSRPVSTRPATQLGWRSYAAPEISGRKALLRVVQRAKVAKKKVEKLPESKVLSNVKSLEILPSLRRSQHSSSSKSNVSREMRMDLLAEFSMFAELEPLDLYELAREFQGPFYVPAGSSIFRVGETGDFLYFVLAGEVVARRGKKELRRYRRGGFLGEAALFGAKATRRIFSASVARGGGGCALLRMHHNFFRKDLKNRGPVTSLVGPARWRYLEQPDLELQPQEVDVFATGAVWCQLASGSRAMSFFRIKRATTIEDLLDAVATRDIGSFYFLVQEWRAVALIELMVRRASAYEALVCLEEKENLEPVTENDPVEPPQGFIASVGKAASDLQQAVNSAFELTSDAVQASVAVKMSYGAQQSVLQQWERLSNVVTERYGQAIGEVFGDLYGNLFAKDVLWMFRNPTRAQRFPVLLVRDAEDGNLLARWQIGASMVFESELCARTLPRVLPSLRPALVAGYQIGSAVGRNRAINFKRLWIDAFMGEFFRQLWAVTKIRAKRLVRRRVKWDTLGSALKASVVRGQTARNLVLTKFGRLPTKYDQNDPQVLQLLPSKWVPEIGLPLASGVGRGFMTKWWKGFRSGWRRRYVRPRFETWDLEDVPEVVLDFARRQGAEQANLVASSVGDTMARDWGYWTGHFTGMVSGLMLCMLGKSKSLKDDTGMVVADGHLEEDRELIALEQYMGDSKYKGT